jgi:hypothetical protein
MRLLATLQRETMNTDRHCTTETQVLNNESRMNPEELRLIVDALDDSCKAGEGRVE